MAFLATMQWDVRTSGSDSNGGGFDPTAGVPGTDYSQQNSPQVTYTDLVIDGTTNTKCTSAAFPFTSAHVGNVINITSGTGFTVQRVQIISVSAAVATCDKSLGTLSSTGGNGKLGGGLLTIPTAAGLMVSGNRMWIKSGTYTLTSVVSLTAYNNIFIAGYGTTHGDFGTPPLITTSTNSTKLFRTGSGDNTARLAYNFINLHMSNTASVRDKGVEAMNGNAPGIFYRCQLIGFSEAIGKDSGATFAPFLHLEETEIGNCTVNGAITTSDQIIAINCYIHDITFNGIQAGTGGGLMVLNNSLFTNCGDAGFGNYDSDVSEMFYIINGCTFAGNGQGFRSGGSSGPVAAAIVSIVNSIFYDNTTGVLCPLAPRNGLMNRNNAYGANGADRTNYPAGVEDVTLSADPFTNAAGGDYSLNNTTGGGVDCTGTGYQWE